MRTDICIAFGLVDQYRLYVVRTQTVARFDCQKFPFGRIVDIETSVVGAYPYVAVAVLSHLARYIVGYRTAVVGMFPNGGELVLVRMVVIETSEKRTEPYAAIIVDIDSSYRRMAQTTLGRRGVVFENNFFCVQHPEDKGR